VYVQVPLATKDSYDNLSEVKNVSYNVSYFSFLSNKMFFKSQQDSENLLICQLTHYTAVFTLTLVIIPKNTMSV